MTIDVHIEGLPPKKDGALSMWGKPVEQERLARLRRAVSAALASRPAFERNIRLILRVHVGRTNSKTTGDLDNFITGVCDALMAAEGKFLAWICNNPESPASCWWGQPEITDIHPSRTIAIKDDSQVVYIQAEKVLSDTDAPWYELSIEGE